ncbi:MAG TPA: hypothetical protein VFF09_04545 [archaeon]|nr:hypothetical protein [archaeon]
MGLLNNFFGKKEDGAGQPEKDSGKPVKAKPENKKPKPAPEGRYDETCSLCGAGGTDKKWAGQYWHVKCIRMAKKQARKMI